MVCRKFLLKLPHLCQNLGKQFISGTFKLVSQQNICVNHVNNVIQLLIKLLVTMCGR